MQERRRDRVDRHQVRHRHPRSGDVRHVGGAGLCPGRPGKAQGAGGQHHEGKQGGAGHRGSFLPVRAFSRREGGGRASPSRQESRACQSRAGKEQRPCHYGDPAAVRNAVFPHKVRKTHRRMKNANVHEPVREPAGNVAIRPSAVAMRHDLIDTPMPPSRLTRPLESLSPVPGTMRRTCEMRGAGSPRRASRDQTSLRRGKMLALTMWAAPCGGSASRPRRCRSRSPRPPRHPSHHATVLRGADLATAFRRAVPASPPAGARRTRDAWSGRARRAPGPRAGRPARPGTPRAGSSSRCSAPPWASPRRAAPS